MKRLIQLSFLFVCTFVSAQNLTFEAVQDSLLKQLSVFPQEKIHVHTDRTMYVPGEKIWFKAYVVDAFSHLSPTYSQYVYVELINASDSLVHRVMVSGDENGLFHGYFMLPNIAEGDYTLRAYTRYLDNLGDDYFFKKNIRIGSISGGNDERSEGRVNLLAMQSKEEFFSRREKNGDKEDPSTSLRMTGEMGEVGKMEEMGKVVEMGEIQLLQQTSVAAGMIMMFPFFRRAGILRKASFAGLPSRR